jgi:hypothetical protein
VHNKICFSCYRENIIIIKSNLLVELFLLSLFVDNGVLELFTSSASSVLKFSPPLPFDIIDFTDEPVGLRFGELNVIFL